MGSNGARAVDRPRDMARMGVAFLGPDVYFQNIRFITVFLFIEKLDVG